MNLDLYKAQIAAIWMSGHIPTPEERSLIHACFGVISELDELLAATTVMNRVEELGDLLHFLTHAVHATNCAETWKLLETIYHHVPSPVRYTPDPTEFLHEVASLSTGIKGLLFYPKTSKQKYEMILIESLKRIIQIMYLCTGELLCQAPASWNVTLPRIAKANLAKLQSRREFGRNYKLEEQAMLKALTSED